MDDLPLPENERIAFAMLAKAAKRGDECPSNGVLATAMGCSSIATASNVVRRLERRGLITVDRGRQSRVVTICADGSRTAGRIPPKPGKLKSLLAECVSNGLSLAGASREIGISPQYASKLWQDIRAELGWQAV